MLAVELGAAALGFVFWPRSPRAVTAATVRAITDGLPPFVSRVGVFVNEPPAEVLAIAAEAGLTCIQLHGDEDASDYVDTPLPVIKALPVGEGLQPVGGGGSAGAGHARCSTRTIRRAAAAPGGSSSGRSPPRPRGCGR